VSVANCHGFRKTTLVGINTYMWGGQISRGRVLGGKGGFGARIEHICLIGIGFGGTNLTPKISWNQKLFDCNFGSLCEEFLFFQFFLLDEWTTYFISILGTPSMYNSCSKWILSSFFLYFLRSSYMKPCG
jgi:hypothetical protein